jgi:hypothetical protein
MVYPAGGGESTGGFRGRPLAGAGWQVAQRRTLAAVFRRLLPPQAGQSQRGRPRGTGPRAARLLAAWMAWRDRLISPMTRFRSLFPGSALR